MTITVLEISPDGTQKLVEKEVSDDYFGGETPEPAAETTDAELAAAILEGVDDV